MYFRTRERSFDLVDDDSTIYSREFREQLVDEDEVTTMEDGFMAGYEDGFADVVEEEDLSWQEESHTEEVV